MTQDYERRRREQQYDTSADLPSGELAERLSAAEAERVLRRAIEHQSEADVPAPTIDVPALERVAAEVGVDRVHLARALAEIRSEGATGDYSLVDRLLCPDRIVASAVVERPQTQVEAAVHEWMTQHEGLRLRAPEPNGGRWEKDTHLLTRLRLGLRLGGRAHTLRRARGVTHRVRPIDDDEQAVAIEADTSRERALGVALLGAGTAAAAAGGAAAAIAGEPGLALGIAGGWAAYSTAVILGIRMWAGRVRDALGRALDGIRHPGLSPTGTGLPEQLERLRRDVWIWRRRT